MSRKCYTKEGAKAYATIDAMFAERREDIARALDEKVEVLVPDLKLSTVRCPKCTSVPYRGCPICQGKGVYFIHVD